MGEMNPELKAKWVAALRSGEYQQGRGALKTHLGYCCLGVLCVVAGVRTEEHSGPENFMPRRVADSSGLSVTTQRHLALALNDRARKSFPEIADWIEANL